MKVDLAAALNRAIQRRAVGATPAPTHRTSTAASTATRVVLSQEAGAATDANQKNAAEMRELLSKYDFHSITPRQMARIGSELFARHELSDVAASSFIGIENDLAVAQDPDKPVDALAHFQHLLSVEVQYQGDNGTDNGVRFRQTGLDALRDVMTFASSDRLHISS